MPDLDRLIRPLIVELRPEPARIALARDRLENLVAGLDRISDRFTVVRVRSHGSIERGTAICGFDDIDQIVVLDPGDLRTRAGRRPTPGYTIRALAEEIERLRGGLIAMGVIEVWRQLHSVGVHYPASALRIDLVPALATEGPGVDVFEIPSRSAGRWITTDVAAIEGRAKAAPPTTIEAIRLIKGWRRARGRNKGFSLPGYAIESMVLDGMAPAPATPPLTTVRAFYERFAVADKRRRLAWDGRPSTAPVSVYEPRTGENLMRNNTAQQRRALIEKSRWTLAKLDEAAEAATDARAQALLRQVFIGAG